MTALWGSLIVLGISMILFAVWPSIRGRKSGEEAGDRAGEKAGEKVTAAEQDGFPPGP